MEKTHGHESSSKHSSKPAVALPILWQHTKVWAGCTLDSCRGILVIGLGAFSASWLGRCQHSHGMMRDWDPTTVWYGRTLAPSLIQHSTYWLREHQTPPSSGVIRKLSSQPWQHSYNSSRIQFCHSSIHGWGRVSSSTGKTRDEGQASEHVMWLQLLILVELLLQIDKAVLFREWLPLMIQHSQPLWSL